MNVVLVMDSFRIFFRFHEWKGKAIDEVGESTDDASKAMYRDLEEKGNKAFLEGVITSSFVLGALCGALMATYLGEKFGRQRTIMVWCLYLHLWCYYSRFFYPFLCYDCHWSSYHWSFYWL
ncbi:hypothetical protein BCR36DRAFT_370952 [Piromyces finnis]|uniref:Major facilitator superfamily (MFS) profile domain-containing protein n=1 Tax=Piromyces finnis TaxID=1754191 RepID=A0A1Y1V6Y6_9FUNG|nr:hypothetical protein BCR36DRAFT_370952 [Piromyces finnis]|eukprot:ORX48886.1 hypothetical protein BCR36DRAFT_370952 [Piromyces finnis]